MRLEDLYNLAARTVEAASRLSTRSVELSVAGAAGDEMSELHWFRHRFRGYDQRFERM